MTCQGRNSCGGKRKLAAEDMSALKARIVVVVVADDDDDDAVPAWEGLLVVDAVAAGDDVVEEL